MDSTINLDKWGHNSLFKNVNYWSIYTDDLFIVVIACVRLATIFE